MSELELEDVQKRFIPHRWETPLAQDISEEIRATFEQIATNMFLNLASCRERDIVLTKLEEASMWAQKALVAGFRMDAQRARERGQGTTE